jgi:RNA polymerase sigma-70 factor (ECF subfamily)
MEGIKAYIYTATYRACLKHLLQEQHRRQRNQAMAYYFSQDVQKDVEAEIVNREMIEHVRTAIDQLPKRCREVVRLSFYHGMKEHEIASHMGITQGTVSYQRTRAVSLLKKILTAFN